MTALSDLHAAVAHADEVLGCAFTQCRYKPQRDGLPGRCQCGVIDVSANALEAVYRAAKAVGEEADIKATVDEAMRLPHDGDARMFAEAFGEVCAVVAMHDNTLKTCWCYKCLDDPSMGLMNPTMVRMITCPQCGNKRCPRAASHDNACTGSNEPGQDGSEK